MVYPLTYRTRDRRLRCVVLLALVWVVSVVYPAVTSYYYTAAEAHKKLLYYFLHVVVMVTFVVLLLTCR